MASACPDEKIRFLSVRWPTRIGAKSDAVSPLIVGTLLQASFCVPERPSSDSRRPRRPGRRAGRLLDRPAGAAEARGTARVRPPRGGGGVAASRRAVSLGRLRAGGIRLLRLRALRLRSG